MRSIASVVACVGLLLATAGCDPVTDRTYFTKGVGTDVYTQDIVTQTEMQNLYVEHICRQADLTPNGNSCGANPNDPATWWLFVQAGMNDIDQRCDAYLTWIDNVRRSEAPVLKQITDTGTATELIMQATGVGAGPIAIVGTAFGLASNTFTNVTSRLILEVNHSTVQSVVLTRQRKYREQLLGDAKTKPQVLIASKPAAIFALRSYLRLCMPITIETEINNTVTGFERGGGAALDNREPMISAKSVGVAIKSTQPPPATPAVQTVVVGAVGSFEPTVSLAQGKAFQKTLCVDPTGNFGSPGQASDTRTALRQFNAAYRYGAVPADQLLNTTPDTIATFKALQNLRRAQRQVPSCLDAGMRNAFEVGLFTNFGGSQIKSEIKVALTKNQITAPPDFSNVGSVIDQPTRAAIAALRQKFDNGSPELDPKFYDWLSRASDRN